MLSVPLAPPPRALASDAAPLDIAVAAFPDLTDVHLLRMGVVCGYRVGV